MPAGRDQRGPERLTPVLEELRDRASARAYSARWSNGDLEVVQIRDLAAEASMELGA